MTTLYRAFWRAPDGSLYESVPCDSHEAALARFHLLTGESSDFDPAVYNPAPLPPDMKVTIRKEREGHADSFRVVDLAPPAE